MNTALRRAKQEKNDEYYTLLEDIENELTHYPTSIFKNKHIHLPCDDPTKSKILHLLHPKLQPPTTPQTHHNPLHAGRLQHPNHHHTKPTPHTTTTPKPPTATGSNKSPPTTPAK